MFGLSSFGHVLAHGQAILKGVDLSHNYVPFITCEGKCSGHRETFTAHKLVSEMYDKEKEAYEQIYRCTICKKERLFGLTETRITLQGESN